MKIHIENNLITLTATKIAKSDDETIVEFSWNNTNSTFSELLEIVGKLPIPPYLNRESEEKDDETYQTVYSSVDGSVAAPTAGLHFTENVMQKLSENGIQTTNVTLHVGAGTFKPVKSETIADHDMHTEFISVPKLTIETLLNHNGKLIVVGTTSMRTVESLYYIGRKLYFNPNTSARELTVQQWEAYEGDEKISPKQALQSILDYLEKTKQEHLISSTQLIIAPGYEFHFSDAIITNFHQPESTLLLLISAFVGDDWRKIYDYALKNDFRFLSYGDSSLLWRK
jgi:S-adenosylmethionine:tRNA ribosyltransferase-isomerase